MHVEQPQIQRSLSCIVAWQVNAKVRKSCRLGVNRATSFLGGLYPNSNKALSTSPSCYDRLSQRSECKKFIGLRNDSDQEKQDVIQRLMFWLAQSTSFARQRQHVAWTPALHDCPTEAFLNSKMLLVAPPWRGVRSDLDLDEKSVPLGLMPPQSWEELARLEEASRKEDEERRAQRNQGHGRGRGRGGRVGRAVAKSVPGAEPASKKKAGPAGGTASSSSGPAMRGSSTEQNAGTSVVASHPSLSSSSSSTRSSSASSSSSTSSSS